MVMIEAMVCGTPVVALRGGAVPEVVVEGVTGFIRDHPEELPAAMHALDQIDPVACRQHVVRNFSSPTMAAGYAAAYRLATKHSKVTHATARHTTTMRRSLVTGR
jgi:glycosyltransferase involved in cell wall biosynthesis